VVAVQVPFMSFPEVEAVLADAIKFGYVQVQIDHRMGTLHFGGANLRNEGMAGHLSNIAGALPAFSRSLSLPLSLPGSVASNRYFKPSHGSAQTGTL
jgi:hypothetical protein